MNTLGKISWLVSLLAISSVTACGSDDDGGGDGGGALDSGVDQDKPGEDLTQDELEAVCLAQYDYAESKISDADMAKALCRMVALSAAIAVGGDNMAEACEMVDDACNDCIDDPDADGCEDYQDILEPDDPETDCADEEVPDNCSSTVGEIEACFKAEADTFSAILGDLPSCSEISEDTEPPDLDAEIEECETVEENCASALE